MRKLACWNMIWKKKKILRTNKKKYTFSELTVYAQKRGVRAAAGKSAHGNKSALRGHFQFLRSINMRKKHYEFPLEDFISRDEFNRIKKFSLDKETPFLVIDIQKIEKSYEDLVKYMPFAKIHYSVRQTPRMRLCLH